MYIKLIFMHIYYVNYLYYRSEIQLQCIYMCGCMYMYTNVHVHVYVIITYNLCLL